MSTNFIHLSVHSPYSLSQGAVRFPYLLSFARKHCMPAVALTDTNNMFGALEFSLAAVKEGIQPIIGTYLEVHFSEDVKGYMTFLCQTEKGYHNLNALMAKAYGEDRSHPYVTVDEISRHTSDIIVLSGGVSGPLGQLILSSAMSRAHTLSLAFQEMFGDRFYMELTRQGRPEEELTEAAFLKIAYELTIPLVATNPAFFPDKDFYEAHDALMCIAEGRYVSEDDRVRLNPEFYLKSPEDMCTLFADIPEAIEHTVWIAQRCAFALKAMPPRLPSFPSEEGRSEAEELAYQAKKGLCDRLRSQENSIYTERLTYELSVIESMGFSGYFLIVADFVKWAKAQGIPVGPGRGSGAGSLVAYCLTITDIDPIRFNLIFERFLNPERVSMPDFDIDFCQERRDEVIEYVTRRYGPESVAQIITFGKLQARAVVRDVGRVLQFPYTQVDGISKLIPNNPANPVTLQEAIDQEPALKEQMTNDQSVQYLLKIALKLEGLYRHASIHAAGIIIADKPLKTTIPLYRDPRSSMLVTQFSMKYAELAGLVKFDFLGLKTLTVLECAASIVRIHNSAFTIASIPLDDAATFSLLRAVKTVGVFQLESPGMRDVLGKLAPERFEEIIALVALYRPGPMDDIPRYLACRHGEQEVRYPHPLLEPILKETFGVMVYQEQVMQIAQKLAGYSLGGADLLRRAMGKKIRSEMDAQRKIFIEGAKDNGLDESLASDIFDQIAKFAGYGFNKSHSAPYALIAYQTAYMKANHTQAFMCALMTYDKHNTDKLSIYSQELTSLSISLLPPDINTSEVNFSVQEQGIRYALSAIKNVGEQAMCDIIEERKARGAFTNIYDFFQRVPRKILNKRQLENLIWAGAFDSLHGDRHMLATNLDRLIQYAHMVKEEGESLQESLFGSDAVKKEYPVLIPASGTKDRFEILMHEKDSLGHYVSAHPLDCIPYESLSHVPIEALERATEQRVRVVAIITAIKERRSKQGRKFAFATLSDKSGICEVMAFDEPLLALQQHMGTVYPLVMDIQLRRTDEGTLRFLLDDVRTLESVLSHRAAKVRIHLSTSYNSEEVSRLLQRAPSGNMHVSLTATLPQVGTIVYALDKSYYLSAALIEELQRIKGVERVDME